MASRRSALYRLCKSRTSAYESWQEAVERKILLSDVAVGQLSAGPHERPFSFPATREFEPLRDHYHIVATLLRQQQSLKGLVKVSAESIGDNLWKLSVSVSNETPLEDAAQTTRDKALLHSFVSTHTVLSAVGGAFVSMIDPPTHLREAAASCQGRGAWPVLIGQPGQADTMLAAPIILYDYPQVAPESAGDLFDATEIDEILSLRVLTLTDEEKQSMAAVERRTRALLERTESLTSEAMLGLHGAIRELQIVPGGGAAMTGWTPEADRRRLECVHVGKHEIREGDRVRLRPGRRARHF